VTSGRCGWKPYWTPAVIFKLNCRPVVWINWIFLLRDVMHKRDLCRHAVSVRLSVRLPVTFVHYVKTNKGIFESFSPSDSYTILVFPHQTRRRYSDGNPPNGGVECRWGRQKSRFWAYIWLHCPVGPAASYWQHMACCNRPGVVNTTLLDHRMPPTLIVTLIAGSKRRCW